MTLQDAASAFIAGWSTTRGLSGPFEIEKLGRADWLHDPTGRRMGELVGVNLDPEELVPIYPEKAHGAICAIYSSETAIMGHKRSFRSLGWRLLRTEPMFIHRLHDLPSLDSRVVRARSQEHVARICKSAKMRPETMAIIDEDDAPIRLYEASIDGQNVGWVRSVNAGLDAWVSSLNVREAHRRQGLGRALMAALLADDAHLGRRSSVLLASHTGALLYPTLGYERVGTLMLLMPTKPKGS